MNLQVKKIQLNNNVNADQHGCLEHRQKIRNYTNDPENIELKITEFDRLRLQTLTLTAGDTKKQIDTWINRLKILLQKALVVPSEQIPPDRITMNTRLKLKDKISTEQMSITLVFPYTEACEDLPDFEDFKISVLTPLGLSVLGRKEGDGIHGRVKIAEILYQPEANNDFHL